MAFDLMMHHQPDQVSSSIYTHGHASLMCSLRCHPHVMTTALGISVEKFLELVN